MLSFAPYEDRLIALGLPPEKAVEFLTHHIFVESELPYETITVDIEEGIVEVILYASIKETFKIPSLAMVLYRPNQPILSSTPFYRVLKESFLETINSSVKVRKALALTEE